MTLYRIHTGFIYKDWASSDETKSYLRRYAHHWKMPDASDEELLRKWTLDVIVKDAVCYYPYEGSSLADGLLTERHFQYYLSIIDFAKEKCWIPDELLKKIEIQFPQTVNATTT